MNRNEVLARWADRLGQIQADMAFLREEERELRMKLDEARGLAPRLDADGQLFHVTLVATVTNKVDWKAVAQRLEPSRQLLTAHTSEVHGTRLTVRSRQTEAA